MTQPLHENDVIEVVDQQGRRRFVRQGAAFLLGASVLAQSVSAQEGEYLRTDCDQRGGGGQKNPDDAMSDSDAGASADRPGCGTPRKPAITRYQNDQAPAALPDVKRVIV